MPGIIPVPGEMSGRGGSASLPQEPSGGGGVAHSDAPGPMPTQSRIAIPL